MGGYDWISLTTDYGLSDGFVAACHGVIGAIAPSVRVIDVTHLVAPGDVIRAAAVLAQAVPHLPRAVHVAVVDPGVGTQRRGVAIETADAVLVGPDNGLLIWAAEALGGPTRVVELTDPSWHTATVSNTFHGRDIFAPVAARLTYGVDLAGAGPQLDPRTLVRLPEPVVVVGERWIEAEVLTIDRFGNVQLAALGSTLDTLIDGVGPSSVRVGGLTAVVGATFAEAAPGTLIVYVDSADRLAIAVNGGRAAVVLGASPGDTLRLTRT